LFASQEDFEWHYKPVVGDSADQDSRNHGEARNEENGIVRKKTWTTMVLRPAISGTLQPEPFEVEMMAKSHADAGRRGSGVSVGREG
jgi:hypothetical protein